MSRAKKAVVGTIVAVAVLGVLIGIYFAICAAGKAEAKLERPRRGSGERRAFRVPPHAGARQEKNSVQTLDLTVYFI